MTQRWSVECWNCDGCGLIAGCFEDSCSCGADEDPELCCAPSRCDVCGGKGSYVVTQLTGDNCDRAIPID